MTKMMAILVAVSLTLGCATSGSLDANTAEGVNGQAEWEGAKDDDGVPSEEETTTTTEESTTTTYSPPVTDERVLPDMCDGREPQKRVLTEGSVVCRCVKTYTKDDGKEEMWEALWTTYVWDEKAYPNCVVPVTSQVLTRKVRLPIIEPNRSDNPYRYRNSEKSKSSERSTTSASSENKWTADCDIERGKSVVCQVKYNKVSKGTYTCLGTNVRRLTADEKLAYSGGAPCGCKDDAPPKPSGSPPNTWECR